MVTVSMSRPCSGEETTHSHSVTSAIVALSEKSVFQSTGFHVLWRKKEVLLLERALTAECFFPGLIRATNHCMNRETMSLGREMVTTYEDNLTNAKE